MLSLTFKPETLTDKMAIHERWSFSFTLNTSKRLFSLYCPSLDERTLWMHTFFWIIQKNLAKKDQNGETVYQEKIDKKVQNINNLSDAEKMELSKNLIKKAVQSKKEKLSGFKQDEQVICDTDGNNLLSSPRVRVQPPIKAVSSP